MKKFFAIFMVLILVSGVMFALDPKTTELTTTVTGVVNVKLVTSTVASISAFNSATHLAGIDFDLGTFLDDNTATGLASDPFYAAIRTNKATSYDVKLSGYALVATDISTAIGYTVTGGTNTLTVLKTNLLLSPADAVIVYSSAYTSGGARIGNSDPLTVTLTAADVRDALESDAYASTITVEIVVQS